MAITYLGKRTGDANQDGYSVTSSSIIFLYLVTVNADGNYPDSTELLNQAEIPTFNERHPTSFGLRVKDMSVSKSEGSNTKATHEVAISYIKPQSEILPPDDDTAPWDRPIRSFSYDPVDYILPLEKASKLLGDGTIQEDAPVISSAGTQLGITTNKPNMSLKVGYALETITDSWALDFFNTVNAADVVVCNIPIPIECGLIRKFTSSFVVEYDSEGSIKWEYYNVDVEIEVKKEIWKRELVDQSVMFIGPSNSPVRIWSDNVGLYPAATFGYGTRKQIFDAMDAKGPDGDDTFTAKEITDMKDGVQMVDDDITLNQGQLSFDLDGNFAPQFLTYFEFDRVEWNPLSIPISRYSNE